MSEEQVRQALVNQAYREMGRDGLSLPNIQGNDQPDSQFFANDELVQAEAWVDPDLKALIPLYSPLMATSNFDKKTVKLLSLRIKGLMAIKESLAYDDLFTFEDSAKFEANEIYLLRAINDSAKGWRLKALIEKIKTQRLQMVKEGGWLQKLSRGGDK